MWHRHCLSFCVLWFTGRFLWTSSVWLRSNQQKGSLESVSDVCRGAAAVPGSPGIWCSEAGLEYLLSSVCRWESSCQCISPEGGSAHKGLFLVMKPFSGSQDASGQESVDLRILSLGAWFLLLCSSEEPRSRVTSSGVLCPHHVDRLSCHRDVNLEVWASRPQRALTLSSLCKDEPFLFHIPPSPPVHHPENVG